MVHIYSEQVRTYLGKKFAHDLMLNYFFANTEGQSEGRADRQPDRHASFTKWIHDVTHTQFQATYPCYSHRSQRQATRTDFCAVPFTHKNKRKKMLTSNTTIPCTNRDRIFYIKRVANQGVIPESQKENRIKALCLCLQPNHTTIKKKAPLNAAANQLHNSVSKRKA